MYEKLKENQGFSRVGEGPGAQVGATWAQQSRLRGVRTAKMTSKRVAGGVRAIKVRPVRLDSLPDLWRGMQRAAPDSQIEPRQRPKSIYPTGHMIRSSLSLSLYIYIYI